MAVSLNQLIEIFGEPDQRNLLSCWWNFDQVRLHVRMKFCVVKRISWVQTRGIIAIKDLTFEEALEMLPRDIREKVLFHLDIFLEPINEGT